MPDGLRTNETVPSSRPARSGRELFESAQEDELRTNVMPPQPAQAQEDAQQGATQALVNLDDEDESDRPVAADPVTAPRASGTVADKRFGSAAKVAVFGIAAVGLAGIAYVTLALLPEHGGRPGATPEVAADAGPRGSAGETDAGDDGIPGLTGPPDLKVAEPVGKTAAADAPSLDRREPSALPGIPDGAAPASAAAPPQAPALPLVPSQAAGTSAEAVGSPLASAPSSAGQSNQEPPATSGQSREPDEPPSEQAKLPGTDTAAPGAGTFVNGQGRGTSQPDSQARGSLDVEPPGMQPVASLPADAKDNSAKPTATPTDNRGDASSGTPWGKENADADAPDAKPSVIVSATLEGASQYGVRIRQNGSVEDYPLTATVPGLGRLLALRAWNGTWELVTDEGLIRPAMDPTAPAPATR